MTLEDFDKISENNMQNVAFAVKGDHVAWTQVKQFTSKSSCTGVFLCRGLVFVFSVLACGTDQLNFRNKNMVKIIVKQ